MINKKNIKYSFLILNNFGVFGVLFSFAILLFSYVNYEWYDFSDYEILIISFLSYLFFIIFLSKVNCKYFFGDDVDNFIINRLILILIYYVVAIFRFFFLEHYGIRWWLGFTTPLWILCPLIILKTVDIKFFYLTYFLICFESVLYYIIYFSRDINDIKLFPIYLTVLILLFFPFFYLFLKNIDFKLKINKLLALMLSIFVSLLGVFFCLFYYFLF